MEFHFTNKLEEYYQKFVELQEKLRKSEEQRFQLEMKFNEMVQIGRQEQQEHYRKLRAQYKRFLEEDKKRQERNERILRNLERVETRISMLSAKTERIDLLRQQYRNYLIRITTKTPEESKWKPIIKEEPQKDYRTPLLECELALPRFKVTSETQTNQEQMKILDTYLENMSSRNLLNGKTEKTLDLPYNSNKASAIAEEIMNSIYSRHYNKEMPKVKESGDTTRGISSNEAKKLGCNFTDNKQSGDECNLFEKSVDDFKPLESVYSLAHNEIDERPNRGDTKPTFVSALDVAVQPKSEQTLFEDNAEPNLVEVSEVKPNNQVEVSTIYYNQEYQPSETQIDDSKSREEILECDNSNVEVEVESTENFEESESRKQVVEHDELENPIFPVESTENSEVVQPSETHLNDSETREQVIDVTENAEVENIEGTTNFEEQQSSVVENSNNLETEPKNTLELNNQEPYYQSDLTFAEQYDQQEDGIPSGYDQYGQPFVYNQQGEIVQPQFDENGQMLPQYDENGQLIMLYDHEGRAYFEETQPPYEDYGYGGQDGADDQSYLQNPQDFQQPNIPEVAINEIGEQKLEGYEQFDQQHEKGEMKSIQQEEVVEKQEEVQQLVMENAEEEVKSGCDDNVEGRVMDILDTDTEASSKHNTSKVSNDTDFDFS